MSGRAALLGALLGAFSLGLLTGLLWARALPFDPTRILCAFFFLIYTIWLAVLAVRRNSAHRT
jgi:multisubunit Na+/H+ antiporter MnhE subunit